MLVGVAFALVAGVEVGLPRPLVLVPLVEPTPGAAAALVLAVIGFVVVNLLVALVLPLALYLDASAVADAGLDWAPDPGLYAVAALAGLLVQLPIGALVGLYYLSRRHGAVGVP